MGGWAYYYPLARTVMGGLISSTVLTLVVLPYINYGVENAANWARRVWAGSAARAADAPGAGAPSSWTRAESGSP